MVCHNNSIILFWGLFFCSAYGSRNVHFSASSNKHLFIFSPTNTESQQIISRSLVSAAFCWNKTKRQPVSIAYSRRLLKGTLWNGKMQCWHCENYTVRQAECFHLGSVTDKIWVRIRQRIGEMKSRREFNIPSFVFPSVLSSLEHRGQLMSTGLIRSISLLKSSFQCCASRCSENILPGSHSSCCRISLRSIIQSDVVLWLTFNDI